jgi:sulfoxide reductase catalytic subunit YedY
MLIRRPPDVPASEITPEHLSRREFLAGLAAAGVLLTAGERQALARTVPRLEPDDKLTPYESVTTYNNFYEFGTDKSDPAENSKNFKAKPWKVRVEGEVARPGEYDFDDLVNPYKAQEQSTAIAASRPGAW